MDVLLGDENTTGKSAGEFPILYYAVGKMWQMFGESYMSYRIFWLLILFSGLFFFYKSLNILFQNTFWAIALALLLFTSPVYAVYGISFLTDVPAFSFVLVALYCLLQYHRKNSKRMFFLAMLFFALAGGLKVSSMIAFTFFFFVLTLETFVGLKSLGDKKLFQGKLLEWAGFSGVLLLIFLWYFYAHNYNTAHGFKYTFNGIYPLWQLAPDGTENLISRIKEFSSHIFASRPLWFVLFAGMFVNFLLRKKMPPLAYLANIVVLVGAVLYFILWAPLFSVHDYYYTPFLILFLSTFIPLVWYLKTEFPDGFGGFKLKSFGLLFLTFNFLYCLNITQLKFGAREGNFVFVGNHTLVDEMTWINWDVNATWMRYERMRDYLDEVGVGQDDRVVSFPDGSFNLTMYLADRKGWTNYKDYQTPEEINNLISAGAKYMFVSDPAVLEKEFLQPFMTDQVGEFEKIKIFRLTEQSTALDQ